MTGVLAAAGASISHKPLFASVSPASYFGEPTTTTPFSVTASDGVAPYQYAWTRVSGDPMTISSPTSSSTTITYSGGGSATFACTVTDAAGGQYTVNITVDFFVVVI